MSDIRDAFWMTRALEIAERGRGGVEPNPLVGAVVVREGKRIGEGWHERFGQAHAEVAALAAAGEPARGATLYVTLEPCCHHGKTPPCTEAIIRAGIKRLVAAMYDPFSEVSGRGCEALEKAGVAVEVGLADTEARRLNAPYLKLLATGRPYVHAKWAMSLDGKIATRTGESKWISSETARQRTHALRGRMDAIVVGIGTALADDPLLTARPPGPRSATRIILDSQGRLPPTARLVQTCASTPTLIAGSSAYSPERFAALQASGCEVLNLPCQEGQVNLTALLNELGRRRMTNVLVEGGSEVLGSFADAHAIDEVHVDIAPILIGGDEAKTAVAGRGVARVTEALRLSEWKVERAGDDFYLHGCFRHDAGNDR